MQIKSIAGHELTPGKTVKDHIHVEGTELHVPHVLLCGEQPGPTVLISAGIHNAEYVGIQAAIELRAGRLRAVRQRDPAAAGQSLRL